MMQNNIHSMKIVLHANHELKDLLWIQRVKNTPKTNKLQ
jgi:hypothetical protein